MNSPSPREGAGGRAGSSKVAVRLEAVRRHQAISVTDLAVFVDRNQSSVTGHVAFPYKAAARDHCPIDYRCTDSPSPREGAGGRAGSSKAAVRLKAVRRYQALVAEDPKRGKRSVAAGVIEESGGLLGSVRTPQSWVRKMEPPTAAASSTSSSTSNPDPPPSAPPSPRAPHHDIPPPQVWKRPQIALAAGACV